MSYLVQKDPIRVREIKDGLNVKNFPERDNVELASVPVGVPDKYLKWELDVLVEMTTAEKAVVNGAALAIERVKYLELRKREYPSTEEMVVALWEKLIENRDSSVDSIQAKRIAIKAKYPKPE